MSSYKTDNGGTAVSCSDIKLFSGSSTWNTRLSQIAKTDNPVFIMTHGFPRNPYDRVDGDNLYLYSILDKRPYNIFIICNSDSIKDAKYIKEKYHKIRIRLNDKINAKVVMISPRTVMCSSADFGYSKNMEFGVGFHSEEIYKEVRGIFQMVWDTSSEII